MLKIEIKTGNAAYRDEEGNLDPYASELCKNLSEIRDKLKNGYDEGVIMDVNGNKVGTWKLED